MSDILSLALLTEPLRGQEKNTREIPLREVYSTSGQKELRQVRKVRDKIAEQAIDDLDKATLGPDNIALVRGNNIGEAVYAGKQCFLGNVGARAPWLPEAPQSEEIWLLVYIGDDGSSPHQVIVKSTSVVGNTIRFTYEWADTIGSSDDLYHYLYWVPLGKLKVGTYQLELVNAKDPAQQLKRTVKVSPKPR